MNKAIKKIELDLGGKVVSLTPKQAQNLKDALDDLFGKEIIKVIEKEYIRDLYPIPYPVPYQPLQPFWEWRREPYYYGTTGVVGLAGTYTDDKCYCSDSGTLRLTG